METSGIVVIINIIVLLIAFFIKSVHDYYHTQNVLHPKLDIIKNVLDQLTNNNPLLKNNENNDTVKKVENILNEANKIEELLLEK